MINTRDQEELFKLIANYLEEDITCLAIGGTAMMFSQYKNTTKDIDIIFDTEKDRTIFVNALKKLGYQEKTLIDTYDEKRRKHTGKPKMYTRGEERFDLFVKNVFGFELNIHTEQFTQKHDFIGKKDLIIKILSKEYLILLKSITGREKDQEDIETIIKIEKNIDWNVIIQEAIKQRKNNQWLLHDLESTLQELKKITLIKQKYFESIYEAEQKHN